MSATQQDHPHAGDDAELAELGYRQRLNRSLGSFSSFAAGFSYRDDRDDSPIARRRVQRHAGLNVGIVDLVAKGRSQGGDKT